MRRRHLYCFALSLVLLLLASCASRQTAATLNDVETYIQSRPDSALATIRAIDTTTLTTRSLRAHYALLHAMALDKNWIDTTDVGVVMPAVEYYDKHGTADQKMKAWYYLGRIYENQDDINQSVLAYTLASNCSSDSKDEQFKGMLYMSSSLIYSKARQIDKALDYANLGIDCFQSAQDSVHYNLSFGRLAMLYQQKKEWHTADSLYQIGLQLAAHDTMSMALYLSYYASMKVIQPEVDPEEAIALLKRRRFEYHKPLSLKDFGTYALASTLIGDFKTCDSILEMIHQQPESLRKETIYMEYRIARYRGDYPMAMEMLNASYNNQFDLIDHLLNRSVNQTLEEYYENQTIETKHKSQVQRLSFVILILGLSLIFGVFVFWSIRKREKERIAADNLIRIAEEANTLLAQTRSEFSSLQQSYIQLFKNQFDTVSSLCKTYMKNQGKPEETRKTAVYGKVKDILAFIGKDKKQQELFEEQINHDLNNVVARLKADLGKVSEEDSRFICYTIAGFDPNIVATFLNLSLSNVYTKRSRLRDRIRQLDSPYKDEYLRVI